MEPIGINPKASTAKNDLLHTSNLRTIKVLLIGNNPIDISHCSKTLSAYHKKKFFIDFTFDVNEVQKKAHGFKPDVIAIDDNIGFADTESIIKELKSEARTAHIPIIVIKNSNYHPVSNFGIAAYILRDNINSNFAELALNIANQSNITYGKGKSEGWFSFLWGK